MITRQNHKIKDLKLFFQLLNKFQKIFNISYIEIILDENDGYIKTKDGYLFIVDLYDGEIFVTHEDVHSDKTFSKAVLNNLDKFKIKYIVDDYCVFL